eukprot:scaffold72366_cov63-Phaeocystis_antarctica.AAC.2
MAAPWVLEPSPLRCAHQPREVDEALHGAARRADYCQPLVAPHVGPELAADVLELVDPPQWVEPRADRQRAQQPEVARVEHVDVSRA